MTTHLLGLNPIAIVAFVGVIICLYLVKNILSKF